MEGKIQVLHSYIEDYKRHIEEYESPWKTFEDKKSYIMEKLAFIEGLYNGMEIATDYYDERLEKEFNKFHNFIIKKYEQYIKEGK